jgi:small GTP-binding protein
MGAVMTRETRVSSPGGLLDQETASLLERERACLSELLLTLEAAHADDSAIAPLRDCIEHLEQLFLLVVVGEFNAGKSVFVNALLGRDLLEQGVTPTTSRIHLVRWGDHDEPVRYTDSEGIEMVEARLGFLTELALVDTPGTNAIDREHEALTRRFVPRADLVLFVTSADRPFTESERAFLEALREWGKKIVVVVNKADLLDDDQMAEVETFIRKNCHSLLGFEPEVLPVSARAALRSKLDPSLPPDPGFVRLEAFLEQTFDQLERLRLKLLSPLLVADKVVADQQQALMMANDLMKEDLRTIDDLEGQMLLYQEDLEREFAFRSSDVEKLVYQLENRGVEFFDERLRLRRIPDLLNPSKTQLEFERAVIEDMPQRIERQVGDIIDWMVESELRQWHGIQKLVRRREQHHGDRMVGSLADFESSRAQLLETLGRSARRAVDGYDRKGEAERMAASVRQAIAGAALLEAGAVGLSGLVALLASTTAADITGMLAAGALATLGLFVLPARRSKAKSDLRKRLAELRAQLLSGLGRQFGDELARSRHRLLDAVAPYTRFVRAEKQRLDDLASGLDRQARELRVLERDIERTLSQR